jgi:methylthioxylose transferase
MIATEAVARRAHFPTRRRVHSPTVVLATWGFLVTAVAISGSVLGRAHPEIHLNAPPLFGLVSPHLSWRVAPAVVLGTAAIICAPRVAQWLRWSTLLVVVVVAAAAWALALSFAGGESSWYGPLAGGHDYLGEVDRIDSLWPWVVGFTEHLADLPVHVQGHPPGFVVFLYGLGQIGLGGPQAAAVLVLGVGASGAAAVLIALRRLIDEETARAAAPFVVLAPAAIWIATSADALFAGVAAWAIALGLTAVTGTDVRADVTAIAGGIVFGIALLLTYGVAPLGLLVIAAAWNRRQMRPVLLYAPAAVIPLVVAAALGFSWPSGLLATRSAYLAGVAADRPYWFFLASNVAAFTLILGPATLVALARAGATKISVVILPALVAVGFLALSGMTKGEVERIWLPYALWILPVAYLLPEASRRLWLAGQVATAVAIEVVVVTPW